MHLDFLIIGQGISGTWLSYYLYRENKSFLVIDDNDSNASSRLSAGVINPVTGRRHVEVWMADQVLPFAWTAYHELGAYLDIHAISIKSLIDFFPSPQMRESFLQRVSEKKDYVFEYENTEAFQNDFRFEFGAGEIKPVYIAHLESILPAWKNFLQQKSLILEEEFDINGLVLAKDHVEYKSITAGAIIFCNGHTAASSPWFKNLPFAPNKGEILISEIPGLNQDFLYKKGMVMVPLVEKNLWWIGSDYKWEYENELPTTAFKEKTISLLNNWLKIPFKIVNHLAGIRPATIERRPFVGMHPVYKNVGLLNGMGTKGCSLAPFFAKQLSDHVCHRKPIQPDADIRRFERILGRM